MRLHHALIRATTLLATTVLAVAVVSVVWWYQCRQLDPTTLDREELLRPLVTYDLVQVSPQTRWLLARRLEEEFSAEIDWEAINDQLTPEHRARLWSNVPLVLEPWFMDKVRRYHDCEASERMTLLDRMIDTLSAWKGIDTLRPAPGESQDLKALLLEQIAVWRSQAKANQQDRIDELVTAVEVRWMFRQLAGTLDSPE